MRRPGSIQGSTRGSTQKRWSLTFADAPKTERHRIAPWIAAFAGSSLVAGASAFRMPPLDSFPIARAVLLFAALVVGIVSFVAFGIRLAARTRRESSHAEQGSLFTSERGLFRKTATGEIPIVTWNEPFGLILLASYGRPIGLLAFTTKTETRYVPVRLTDRAEEDDRLLASIAVLSDLDFVDGVTHDAALSSSDGAELVRVIADHDKSALRRISLSDGSGAPVVLDASSLAVRMSTFDLTKSLEWRALMFHEPVGQAAALFQATWIRQDGGETFLVAPMPASVVPRNPRLDTEANGRLGRVLMRDIRLLQAPSDSPPSRDLRVAIDRPFMVAVRRALADAPLATRISIEPPPRRQSERRGSLA